jgi:hypothetical protein
VPCPNEQPVTLDFVNGVAAAAVALAPSCPFATLIIVGTDETGPFNLHGSGELNWTTQFVPNAASDPFARVVQNGWGTGPLGTWQPYHASQEQYLTVDGAQGVADQLAPYNGGV